MSMIHRTSSQLHRPNRLATSHHCQSLKCFVINTEIDPEGVASLASVVRRRWADWSSRIRTELCCFVKRSGILIPVRSCCVRCLAHLVWYSRGPSKCWPRFRPCSHLLDYLECVLHSIHRMRGSRMGSSIALVDSQPFHRPHRYPPGSS